MRVTFGEAGDYLGRMSGALRRTPAIAARLTAPLLVESIREQIGHAPPLRDLAESTQAERAALGYAPNEPLKRTGTLEESWVPAVETGLGLLEHDVAGSALAAAGSADEIAGYHERGYYNVRAGKVVPPRPAGRLGLMAVQPAARTIWKNLIGRAVGKRN